MRLTPQQIEFIKIAFDKTKTKKDFLYLLNYAKKIVYGEKQIPFQIRQLNYYINQISNTNSPYIKFSIAKKAGGERIIHAPSKGLKSIQKCLNIILQCVFIPHQHSYGFIKEKSVVDNASRHIGSNYVYNIDLKDFFPSISQARVWRCMQNPPFSLNKERGQLLIANMIAALCCTTLEVGRMKEGEWVKEKQNVLPQGAPTSPIITNVVCQKLDRKLNKLANNFGLKYSRYADDITFSSMHNVYQKDGEFSKRLQEIITEQNFHIKESKVRLQRRGFRQEVTGLIVNEKVNVTKRYVKQLRFWIYLLETEKPEKAHSIFLKNYISNSSDTLKTIPNMVTVILGKLNYLRMVKGNDSTIFIKLKERLENIPEFKAPTVKNEIGWNEIINAFANEDLSRGIKLYNKLTAHGKI